MPELPEVETTRQGIAPHIEQYCVTDVIIRQPKLRWPITQHLKKQLLQQKLLSISRRSKYLLFHFPSGTLILHLGMSGRLSILNKNLPANKHDHVDIHFSNHNILRFTDPRRFGAILFTTQDPAQHPLLKNIGVEPLTEEFNANYLRDKIAKRKIPIKNCLLDGHIVAGIGNIYATEALFIAGIDPRKSAQTISTPKLIVLVAAIKYILQQAIMKGGTTLKDFMQADGNPGYFSFELKVYGNANQPCPRCKRKLISIKIAARSTVYCKHCQS